MSRDSCRMCGAAAKVLCMECAERVNQTRMQAEGGGVKLSVLRAVMDALDAASTHVDGPDEPGVHFNAGTILLADPDEAVILVEDFDQKITAFEVRLHEVSDPSVAAELHKKFREKAGLDEDEVTE